MSKKRILISFIIAFAFFWILFYIGYVLFWIGIFSYIKRLTHFKKLAVFIFSCIKISPFEGLNEFPE